jgi:hypothetical protein
MSEQKENQGILSFDWALFYFWLMATTVGWVLGWLVLPTISVVTAGVGAGVMQCFVLYRRMPGALRWILATAIGWLAGLVIVIPVVPPGMGFLSGAVMGATVGAAQWVLLRRQVHLAGWWIVVSILAWSTALSLAPASGSNALPPLVLSGIMPAVVTGITLGLLLNFPKPREETADPETVPEQK